MLYVLYMSTDEDILDVTLNKKWGKPDHTYYWDQIKGTKLGMDSGSTVIVIAHGNGKEIGNEEPGEIDIDAAMFLYLIQKNMKPNQTPGNIYISACAEGIAEFAADVRLHAEANKIWANTKIYGHSDPVAGPVPPPNDMAWHEIFGDEFSIPEVASFANTRTEGSQQDAQPDPPIPKKWPATSLTSPSSATEKYNQPTVKHYVFNETGNIMIASTEPITSDIDPNAKALFEEVAVFFAALTKAITSTKRPGATAPYKPTDYYTIYDYVPLENIVNRSGLFVNVHREDLTYSLTSTTVSINLQFVEALLGVALTDGVGAEALMNTLKAMGKQATFSYNRTKKTQKIGNILFVCEYLLGMPIVSVLYFYLDEEDTHTVVKFSPCFTAVHDDKSMTVHKDTFLFVVPSWIRKYAGDLSSIANDVEYKKLVNELESFISTMPIILNVVSDAHNEFQAGKNYTLTGVNFGKEPGKLYINNVEQSIQPGSGHGAAPLWNDQEIGFVATLGADHLPITGQITVETKADNPLVGISVEEYTIKPASH
nr:hypothetical protein [Allomuricauda sp.]